MHLAYLELENFRLFGSKADARHLSIPFQPGLSIIAGENDAGKSAIIDALRFLLGTRSNDFVRITEDDFHKEEGTVAGELRLYCRFDGISKEEAASLMEWLTLAPDRPILELTMRAVRRIRKNRLNAEVPTIEVTTRSGPNGQGRAVDGEARAWIRATYLKPLRDAESEMTAGRGSRLSQLLLNHPALRDEGKTSDAPKDLSSEGDVQPPPTLKGIMSLAEKWIHGNAAIKEAKKQLNDNYLSHFSIGSGTLRGEISIARSSELRAILEKLELWLLGDGAGCERTRHGLGFNNVLFMAAELLLLSEGAQAGLPLLLVEEPEAHLHPQLQTRLMEFFEERTECTEGVQIIVTTHSPNLAAKGPVERIILLTGGQGFPLLPTETKLLPDDYRFLRRFLDATKANLFFAKGVVMVEGDAENILLPCLAQMLGRPFTRFAISIVNVGSRGLFRYSRIFQRSNGAAMPVRIACLADRDVVPDVASDFVLPSANPAKRPKFAQDFSPTRLHAHLASLQEEDDEVVQTFVSDHWTLEYDLARAGLGKELHIAITLAKKARNSKKQISETDRAAIIKEAGIDYDSHEPGKSCDQLAAWVYEPLFSKEASKAEAAQILADLLEDRKLTPEQTRKLLPSYIVRAIDFVTGNIG